VCAKDVGNVASLWVVRRQCCVTLCLESNRLYTVPCCCVHLPSRLLHRAVVSLRIIYAQLQMFLPFFFVRWIYPSSYVWFLKVFSLKATACVLYGSYAFSIRHCWMGDGYSIRPAKSVSMLSMVVIRLELCTSRVPAATTTSSSSHSSAKSRVVWYSGAGLAQAVLEYRKCCCLCEKAANILVIQFVSVKIFYAISLQCFDTVSWATERASGL